MALPLSLPPSVFPALLSVPKNPAFSYCGPSRTSSVLSFFASSKVSGLVCSRTPLLAFLVELYVLHEISMDDLVSLTPSYASHPTVWMECGLVHHSGSSADTDVFVTAEKSMLTLPEISGMRNWVPLGPTFWICQYYYLLVPSVPAPHRWPLSMSLPAVYLWLSKCQTWSKTNNNWHIFKNIAHVRYCTDALQTSCLLIPHLIHHRWENWGSEFNLSKGARWLSDRASFQSEVFLILKVLVLHFKVEAVLDILALLQRGLRRVETHFF